MAGALSTKPWRSYYPCWVESVFQPFVGYEEQHDLLSNCFSAETTKSLSVSRKAEMPMKAQERDAIQAMVGGLSEASGLLIQPEETGSNYIGWTGLHKLQDHPGLACWKQF